MIRVAKPGLVVGAGAAALALSLRILQPPAYAEAAARALPPPALDVAPARAGLQTAVFAGGCFWGVQAAFQHVAGVVQAVSGYAGGQVPSPKYGQVSTGVTGHA